MRKASLFSGAGGIDLAAHWAGMETVVFCEREPFPQRVLRKQFPGVPIIDDVHDFTRKELERLGIIGPDRTIDLISAGYPCQPFSQAGKRGGTEDDRHLWPEVKRVLQEIRPRWFLGENVAGHITLGLGNVIADLESIGYQVPRINGKPAVFCVPASAVYAAHQRKRVFILGYTEHHGSYGAAIRRGADPAGDNYESGANKTRQSAGTSGRADNAAMADTAGLGRQGSGQYFQPGNTAQDAGGEAGEFVHDGIESERSTQPGMGGESDELSAWLDGSGLNPLDALIELIANYPHPAPQGMPQYDWEPPRVATGVKHRAGRLKALGNAVDPLQVFPFLYGIRIINEWLRRGME